MGGASGELTKQRSPYTGPRGQESRERFLCKTALVVPRARVSRRHGQGSQTEGIANRSLKKQRQQQG